jgi:hypothetical protein
VIRNTPLHIAAERGHTPAALAIVQSVSAQQLAALWNARNDKGLTAADVARKERGLDLAKELGLIGLIGLNPSGGAALEAGGASADEPSAKSGRRD